MVVSLVSPIIRSQLVKLLPFEIGHLIRSFPSPFCIRGEYDVSGTELSILSSPLHKSSIVCELCGYSQTQMEMFYWLQKALDRSYQYPLKSNS